MAITSLPSVPDASEKPRRKHRKVEPVFWWMTVPTLVIFTLAIPVPAVIGIFYSFTNYIGVGKWHFLGLANYIAMFTDPQIRQSYIFTIGFALVTVLAVNVISFLLAVGLTSRIRAKVALRTVFVIPMVISGIVIAYVFQFLFSTRCLRSGRRWASAGSSRAWSPTRIWPGWRSCSSRPGSPSPEPCSSTSPD